MPIRQQDYNVPPQQGMRRMPGQMGQPQMGRPMMNNGMMGQPMMNQGMGQPMMNQGMGQPMMNNGMMGQPMNQGMGQPMMGNGMMGQPMMNQGMGRPMMNNGMMTRPMMNQGMMNQGMMGPNQMNQRQQPMQQQQMQQGGDTVIGLGNYNGEDWNNIKLHDVRDDMTQADAEAKVQEMDNFINTMQGQVDLSVATTGNIDQVQSAISVLCSLLAVPKEWLPTNVSQKNFAAIADKGNTIIKYLKIFSGVIANFQK